MADEDHVDRWVRQLESLTDIYVDPDVEGLLSRINGISRRVKRASEAALAEHGLSHQDWHVLTRLRLSPPDHRSTPGALAASLDLSSGAMTSRLDRLEEAGFVRRVADPDDRRSVVVELTPAGRESWDAAADAMGRREAFFASALTKAEQKQLNELLRKLMIAFEAREPKTKKA